MYREKLYISMYALAWEHTNISKYTLQYVYTYTFNAHAPIFMYTLIQMYQPINTCIHFNVNAHI